MQNVKKISYECMNTIALTDCGGLWVCGDNSDWMSLGVDAEEVHTFTKVLCDVVDFSRYEGYTIALTSDGKLFGCGDNTEDQLSIPGGQMMYSEFVQIPEPCANIEQVSCLRDESYVLSADGVVYKSGSEGYAQFATEIAMLPNCIPKELTYGKSARY
jgi:alpha-tubulin suppressor-like RCC1 family protein